MRSRVVLVVAVVCAVLIVSGTRAQEPSSGLSFRSGVDVVQLDVTVLGRDRAPIHGLTEQAFTVTEDGQPRRVVSLQEVTVPAPDTRAASWTRDVPADVVSNTAPIGRVIVIVFDDANTGHVGDFWDPWVSQTGKRIARDIVNGLGPDDRAAITFTFQGRAQSLTTDRARLLAAIDSYAPKDSPSAGPPLACAMRGETGSCVVDTLEHVANAFPVLPPRRKVIVFLSAGKGMPGLTADDTSEYHRGIEETTSLFRTLQRANVTLYAFNPHGLQVAKGPGDDALRSLAEATGGRAMAETNSPWDAVPALLSETQSYYLLAFEAAHRDGRYHPVSVRVDRSDADVRARRGYVAGRDGAAPRHAMPPIDAALTSGMPDASVPIDASAAVFRTPGRPDATVVVTSRVNAGPAERTETRNVTIRTAAFDVDWRSRGVDTQRVAMLGRPPQIIGDVHAALSLKPGRYEVRVAAEHDGRAGSVFVDAEVPAQTSQPLSLSDVVIGARQPTTIARLSLPVRPTTQRAFSATMPMAAFVQVYEAPAGDAQPVQLIIRVLDTADALVQETSESIPATRFASARTADVLVDLPLARVPSGDFLLTIDAKAGSACVSRAVRFSRR